MLHSDGHFTIIETMIQLVPVMLGSVEIVYLSTALLDITCLHCW